MTQPFAHTLIDIVTAPTAEQTAALTLRAVVERWNPAAGCLLVWDNELARYIVGHTWPEDLPRGEGAAFRRRVLALAQDAYQRDPDRARCLEPDVFYQPLSSDDHHVGAVVAVGLVNSAPVACEETDLLLRAAGRALYTVTRLEQADRDHDQLDAERERLEGLLRAVEQQQRTIDELLAAERQWSASLEGIVEERTAELRAAQRQLIQSEKLAVIGQLASSLAHELNNPLQAIQSGLGLIALELERANLHTAQQDLDVIQAELERIDSLFRQMLDFYRPASFESVPLDLNAISEGARVLMRKRLQEAHVSLHLDLSESLPTTCGDSNQIKQVILNLILNAAEAMPDSDGSIRLRTGANGQRVYLSVMDDGPGIAPEHQARLFEPLFTTKARGLGLGLAISQEIAQRHAGRITVESTPGQGTTFTIELPVRETCHD
jgi:signal transduction histidine kinase